MGFTPYVNTMMISDDSEATLDKVEELVRADFGRNNPDNAKLFRKGNDLWIDIDGWELHMNYSEESHVVQESKCLADSYLADHPLHDTIAVCKKRFDTWTSGKDDMDYFNDYLVFLDAARSFEGVYVFDNNSPEFIDLDK